MKKIVGRIFALVMVCIFVLVMFAGRTVEAAPTKAQPAVESVSAPQVLFSRKCCDGDGVVRCILVNWTPVGDPCFCYNQGWGYTC